MIVVVQLCLCCLVAVVLSSIQLLYFGSIGNHCPPLPFSLLILRLDCLQQLEVSQVEPHWHVTPAGLEAVGALGVPWVSGGGAVHGVQFGHRHTWGICCAHMSAATCRCAFVVSWPIGAFLCRFVGECGVGPCDALNPV